MNGHYTATSPTATWYVVAGSLPDTIVLDTSDELSSPATARSALLARPLAGDEPLPCELTVYFKEQHEIHRVYVRSSARIYEIYYTINGDKDYLCTVCCGEAAKEVPHFTSARRSTAGHQNDDIGTVEKQEILSRADSNNSNEDGWIEVGVPHDPLQTNKQILYEATAEISDASPCKSITIRFLSLQDKSHLHISEVYICSDPVETPTFDGSVEMRDNLGGISSRAMFLPHFLLQLSKSGSKEVQEKSSLDSSHLRAFQEASEDSSLDVERTFVQEVQYGNLGQHAGIGLEKFQPTCEEINFVCTHNLKDEEAVSQTMSQTSEFVEVKNDFQQKHGHSGSSQKATNQGAYFGMVEPPPTSVGQTQTKWHNVQPICTETTCDYAPKPITNERHGLSDNCIERMLHQLVLKVGQIEGFCSRFEEKLMKPLDCIEKRLQRLEQLCDSFATGNQSQKLCCCKRFSAPEFSFINSDMGISDKNSNPVVLSDGLPVAVDNPSCCLSDSPIYSGPAVKASELCNEGDKFAETDDTLDSDATGYSKSNNIDTTKYIKTDGTIGSDLKDNSEVKEKISIDSGLASALASFMSAKPLKEMAPSELSNGNSGGSFPFDISSRKDSFLSKCNLEKNYSIRLEVEEENTDYDQLYTSVAALDSSTLEYESKNNMSERRLSFATCYDSLPFVDDFESSFSPPNMASVGTMIAPECISDEDDLIVFDKASKLNFETYYNFQTIISSLGGSRSSLAVNFGSSASDNMSVLTAHEPFSHGVDELLFHDGASHENPNEANCGNGKIGNRDENLVHSFLPPILSLDSMEYRLKNQNSCLKEELISVSDDVLSENVSQLKEHVTGVFGNYPAMENTTLDGNTIISSLGDSNSSLAANLGSSFSDNASILTAHVPCNHDVDEILFNDEASYEIPSDSNCGNDKIGDYDDNLVPGFFPPILILDSLEYRLKSQSSSFKESLISVPDEVLTENVPQVKEHITDMFGNYSDMENATMDEKSIISSLDGSSTSLAVNFGSSTEPFSQDIDDFLFNDGATYERPRNANLGNEKISDLGFIMPGLFSHPKSLESMEYRLKYQCSRLKETLMSVQNDILNENEQVTEMIGDCPVMENTTIDRQDKQEKTASLVVRHVTQFNIELKDSDMLHDINAENAVEGISNLIDCSIKPKIALNRKQGEWRHLITAYPLAEYCERTADEYGNNQAHEQGIAQQDNTIDHVRESVDHKHENSESSGSIFLHEVPAFDPEISLCRKYKPLHEYFVPHHDELTHDAECSSDRHLFSRFI